MNIEPIHELPADELQHALGIALDHIKAKEKKYSDGDLNTLADSIKESLIFFFPKFDEHIETIIDANEASYAMAWATIYPLGEGVTALRKIYGVTEGLIDDNQAINEMAAAIKDYAAIARQYFLADQKESAEGELDEAIKEKNEAIIKMNEAEPFVVLGKEKYEQLHAPKEKRNKYILQYCHELKKAKPSTSAEHLLSRFPNREKATNIDGALVFKEITENGVLKAFCIMPDGKIKTVSLRKFQNYFDEKSKSKIS